MDFNTFLNLVISSSQMAAIYGIVVLAVVLSFRISNFADLTMDGSFTLGASISAVAIVGGMNPFLALISGALVGGVAGIVTALLHTRLGVKRLLAGIVTMFILYSVNLRIMGRPNISLLDTPSIFSYFGNENGQVIGCLLVAFLVGGLLWWFLRTDLGHFLRAAGENPKVVVRKGFPEELFVVISLFLANSMAAFAGGIAAQHQGFADIGMGVGGVIIALTSLLLGETVLPPRSVARLVGAALVGSLIYQVVISVGLRLGINPWDLKLATGGLLITVLGIRKYPRFRWSLQNIGSDPL